MAALPGNTNAVKRLTYRPAFEAYARANPHLISELVDFLYAVALGKFEAKISERLDAAGIIFDRTDGKAPQAVTVGNEGDEPFKQILWPLPKTTLDT